VVLGNLCGLIIGAAGLLYTPGQRNVVSKLAIAGLLLNALMMCALLGFIAILFFGVKIPWPASW
jgi:hypothetical protein